MRTHLYLSALFSLSLLASCGSSEAGALKATAHTDAGYASLGAGQYEAARESFDKALAYLDPGDPGFERAAMGEIDALIQLDAGQARDRFLDLARRFPALADARDFESVTHKLTTAGESVAAIAVLDAGLLAHPADPDLEALLERVQDLAEQAAREGSGDAEEAMRALSTMAYVGGKG